MARKGNPMSVRLDLNRSSDSSRFSEGDRVSHRMGAIPSTCIMVGAYGAGGDDHPSSSFFEGISAWVQNTPEPGEEGNSQPSQGVGQRLPGSLEISSPDWIGYLNGNENAEKAGAESSTGHNPAHPPTARSSVNHQVLEACNGALENTLAVADLLQQIQRGLHARVPGGFQAEALTETLETRHGTDKLGEIRESLQTEGSQSPYFREFQTDFRSLRDAGGTEKQLRKEWQGRG
ncbi:hypothetical protein L3X38_000164 (mitochondrion) [Prunus dulcis]|uniref:Uncharacterized protein n=1 Tax=Prunus dulcis TaxID=3755 RepID=A0AAD4YK33_PRUDU|nr:hypothetical protein L3X38_000164 [Prunus dulcis]